MRRCESDYEALHSQLMADLPVLNQLSLEVLKYALKSFAETQKTLNRDCAQAFFQLNQVSSVFLFSFSFN